jgi:bifunctional non-homologous end joining protein LigD
MVKLKEYRSKRKFDHTPEPNAKTKAIKKNDQLRFCVQKHQAKRLHYDLRLELEGVLISFAIPKGPSLDPQEKRLAIHVEDHPLDYLHFEGEIPKGNYGAGSVTIWDSGTYHAQESQMKSGLKKGNIKFELNGERLKGEFSLIKMKGQDNDQWLLIKGDDNFAIKKKLMGQKAKMPKWIAPMLATLIDKPFNKKDWLFETKWDGYRALAFIKDKQVRLLSRNQKSFNRTYKCIVDQLKQVDASELIVDGEIVALDEDGVARFELLQGISGSNYNIHYMIFDLLFLDGRDMRRLPLIERKALLQDLLLPMTWESIHLSEYVKGVGIEAFSEVRKMGLEGLIGKQKDSIYVSKRSEDWVKIKAKHAQEFVVGGFTKSKGAHNYFGSLLLGVYEKGHLKYVGRVGTGFDEEMFKYVYEKMKLLIQNKSPFVDAPVDEKVIFIAPRLVAEVSFAQWTKNNCLRQPVFHGLRRDKPPTKINREEIASIDSQENGFKNLEKIFWKKQGYTKGHMLDYYQEVYSYIGPHVKDRPLLLYRCPNGTDSQGFFQKNIDDPPEFLQTHVIESHKKKPVRYALIQNEKSLLYLANLATVEFHTTLSRVSHLQHPDFLVLDLDREASSFDDVIEVALIAHEILSDLLIPHFCKTSGGDGLHIYLPLTANITFFQSFSLAKLLAYMIRSRIPKLVSLARSPKQRQKKIYIDYLQNSQGKSMVAPYSIRVRDMATVSAPLLWQEVKKGLDPKDFTIRTMSKRLKDLGDVFAPVLKEEFDLEKVLQRIEMKL